MLTAAEEAALAARTVRANPRKRDACSRGGYGQKEYGTIFNRLGGLNGAVIRSLRRALKEQDSELASK